MPTYNYRCRSCETTFTNQKPISARKEPEGQPCPACGLTGAVSQMITAPMLNAEVGGSLKKTDDGWKDVLKKIKSNHRHNTIND